ncbi:MAG TPA: protein translocase subunit SecF [Gemmatimonadales bacterium]
MLRLFENARFDFLRARKGSLSVVGAFMLIGLAFFALRGIPESIEFTGGTLVQVEASSAAMTTASIRSALGGAGISGAEITTFGSPSDFLIKARVGAENAALTTQETAAAVEQALTEAFGAGSYEMSRGEAVSAKVGSELRTKALLAILMSFGATLIYLWFRFEWRFGVAAILATLHDIVATVAFLAIMHLELTLVVVAAVLTIVGYSLNDTIIVFDRVRENLHKFKRQNIYEILNRSINETLPRTAMTSATTIAATLALLILGGEVIRGFAWVMTFGIVVGTFSSIYIASPVLLYIEQKWPGEDVRGARTLVADPRTTEAG